MPGLFDPINQWFEGTDMAGQSDLYEPADYAGARRDLLGGLGGIFLAAGMAPPGQRGQIIAQGLPQAMGGYRGSLQEGFKERMLGEKYKGWKGFKEAAAAGKFGDLPPGMAEIMKFTDPESSMKMIGDYYSQAAPAPDFITLMPPSGDVSQARTFNDRDPQVAELLQQGWNKQQSAPISLTMTGEQNKFKNAMDLRQMYLTESADFQKVNSAWANVQSAAKLAQETGSDQSLITAVAKMYDPTSSVMQGEKESYMTGAGLSDQMKAYFTSLLGQGVLGPEIRRGLIDAAQSRYEEQSALQQGRRDTYSKAAMENNADPGFVAPDLTYGVQAKQKQPQINDWAKVPEGAVVVDENGKRFKKVNGQKVEAP